MKILWRLVALVVGVAVVVFALGNRGPISLSFAPLPIAVAMPVYLLVLIALALGIIAGGVGAWRAAGRARAVSRERRRRVAALEGEVERLRAHRRQDPAPDAAQPAIAARRRAG